MMFSLSPYVLKTLSTDKKGLFHTSFKVPDVYGVLQFKVEYKKLGYTKFSLSKQIPVKLYRHNEYQRFIPTAYPYYGACHTSLFFFFHTYTAAKGAYLLCVFNADGWFPCLQLRLSLP
ncbi:LOW QUALITY PROTEIN: hypothetical protein HID58_092060 [Brassica napus]|uniref:OST48 middle domain-containing protein n=1 Tax=Brassica napus TaxID=3708 RepID=A0ABQ7WXP4_BRANA|nr:LOW QUALITY PROTEIN: hypothetical protein HID58_092060 [Brassica napus]